MQVLKERIAWLEARNEELCRELHRYRSRCVVMQPCETDVQVCEHTYIMSLICDLHSVQI